MRRQVFFFIMYQRIRGKRQGGRRKRKRELHSVDGWKEKRVKKEGEEKRKEDEEGKKG